MTPGFRGIAVRYGRKGRAERLFTFCWMRAGWGQAEGKTLFRGSPLVTYAPPAEAPLSKPELLAPGEVVWSADLGLQVLISFYCVDK